MNANQRRYGASSNTTASAGSPQQTGVGRFFDTAWEPTKAPGRARRVVLGRIALVVPIAFSLALVAFWQFGRSVAASGATLLCVAITLRIWSLVRSQVWLATAAWDPRVAEAVVEDSGRRSRPRAINTIKVYAECGGLFFPFGARAILLRAAAEKLADPTTGQRIQARFWKGIQIFWMFPVWILTISIAVLVSACLKNTAVPVSTWWIILAGQLLLCVGCAVLAVEVLIVNAFLGRWQISGDHYSASHFRSSPLRRWKPYLAGILSIIFSDAALIALVASRMDGFAKLSGVFGVDLAFRSSYYAFTALTGNGDAEPVVLPGFMAMYVIYVQSVVYLVLVVSIVWDQVVEGISTRG